MKKAALLRNAADRGKLHHLGAFGDEAVLAYREFQIRHANGRANDKVDLILAGRLAPESLD